MQSQTRIQDQTQMRQQQRLRIHATDQQRQQYADCTRATQRLRTRLRDMSRLSQGQSIGAGQATQWREQLRNEIQAMQQEQEQLRAGLSDEQKQASARQLQQAKQSADQLEAWSEALGFELEQQNVDAAKVSKQADKMEGAAKKLQKQQQEIASSAGIK
jgi:hypothetical protein